LVVFNFLISSLPIASFSKGRFKPLVNSLLDRKDVEIDPFMVAFGISSGK